MAIAKKPTREKNQQSPSLDSLIDKGGSTAKRSNKSKNDISLVQLRLPQGTVDEIDGVLEQKMPKPTRHHWLLEAIYEKLKKDKEML